MNAYRSRRLLAAVALLSALGCAQPEETATTESAAPGTTPAETATPDAAPEAQTPISPETLPAVVAEVNGYEVERNDLVQAVGEAQAQLAQLGQNQLPTLPFVRDVLDHVIAQILLEQDGKKAGVVPSEGEIDKQIEEMKARAPSLEAFTQTLSQRGVTEDKVREQIRRKLAVERYLMTRVVVRRPPEEAEIRAFYDQNPTQMTQGERRHLRHILVAAAENAAQPVKFEARKKAETILGRLHKGESFAKLADEYSDDPGSKGIGGDLSWVTRGRTVPPFEKAAFALQEPNDLSGVVESPFGYHIIQLVAIEAASLQPYEEVKPQIAGFLQQKNAKEQVDAKIKELRDKAKLKIFI